ncbi:hypothetical protein AAZX31_15G164800 [Glycine max]|uniref:Uncharacterized protein n=1 Tax=Glycine soja TaxID=3848 RepID=A0A445GUS9_GLYSO|nr:hypothetical protein D0Y65_041191 [Glycine soja]
MRPLPRRPITIRRRCYRGPSLVYLYSHLSCVRQYSSKQCGGYMTLLMSWVFAHLSTVGYSKLKDYVVEDPIATK